MRGSGPDRYDALIVGAGPSGSAAAIRLLQASPGLSVGLADKQQFPRDKACGDGLSPAAVQQLGHLGLEASEIWAFAQRVGAAEIHGPDGLTFEAGLGGPLTGAVARRQDLDHALRDAAIRRGAEPLHRMRFKSFRPDHCGGGALLVVLRDELTGADREVRCRLLVGADGANSRIRRQTGAKPEPPHRTGIAIRAYAQIGAEMSDRLILSFEDWLRPGYGWVFPLGGGAANIGVGVTVSDHRRRRADLGLLLANYTSALTRRGVHVNGPLVGHRTYRLPHAGFGRHVTGRGLVALIGDAASMINPLSGEGIAYGLAAAEILAAACAPALAAARKTQPASRRDLSIRWAA